MSADEFATVCGRVAEWGVVVDDAAAAYGALCGGGELAFGVFAAWCLKLSLATLTADCLETATLENEGGLAADGAALLPPPEPLDPVLEDAERSFSATDLGSVKRGFYDAAEADAASEDVKRELSSKLEEQTSRLEEALAELENSGGFGMNARRSARENVDASSSPSTNDGKRTVAVPTTNSRNVTVSIRTSDDALVSGAVSLVSLSSR